MRAGSARHLDPKVFARAGARVAKHLPVHRDGARLVPHAELGHVSSAVWPSVARPLTQAADAVTLHNAKARKWYGGDDLTRVTPNLDPSAVLRVSAAPARRALALDTASRNGTSAVGVEKRPRDRDCTVRGSNRRSKRGKPPSYERYIIEWKVDRIDYYSIEAGRVGSVCDDIYSSEVLEEEGGDGGRVDVVPVCFVSD